MLIRVVQMAWVIIVGTFAWLGMLIRWIIRNPEWADQVKNHECPRPWFFQVWTIMFIIACICLGFLLCYYILTFYLTMRG